MIVKTNPAKIWDWYYMLVCGYDERNTRKYIKVYKDIQVVTGAKNKIAEHVI